MAPNTRGPVTSHQLPAPGLSLARAGLTAVSSQPRSPSPSLLETAASYSTTRTGLRAAESVLAGAAARAPTGPAATGLDTLARAARAARRAGARVARQSGGGLLLPGWILYIINAFLVPVVGIELRHIKHVSFEGEQETTDEETTEEESGVESEAQEPSDEELSKYVEGEESDFDLNNDEMPKTEAEEAEAMCQLALEQDEHTTEETTEESDVESEDELEETKELSDEEVESDFELTTDEIPQTEAEEAMASEQEIFADRKSPCFENKNMEQIIEFVNQNMLEEDYLPEGRTVQTAVELEGEATAAELDGEATAAELEGEVTAAELEAAERERLEAAQYVEELEVSSYSCPVPQCDMAPIDLSQMMAGTAISHLVSEHGLAEGDVTKPEFHFKKEPGAEYEEWYDAQPEENECKHQVEDEVVYLAGHCLPKALPGSAAEVVEVEEKPEDENIVLEHKGDICFNGEMCHHQNCDVLYDGGHCLPKDLKVEPEGAAPETVSSQVESFANRSATAEEILAVRTMDLQAMLEKFDDTSVPTSMELFIAETVEEASGGKWSVEVAVSSAGGEDNLVDTAGSIELGASCTGGDLASLLGAAGTEAEVEVSSGLSCTTPGLSCTGGDINSLLSQMESMGFQN